MKTTDFKIVRYLEKKKFEIKGASSGREIRIHCPFCPELKRGEDTKGKLHIHVEKDKKFGLWNCFRCGETGNLLGLIMRLEKSGFMGAMEVVQGGQARKDLTKLISGLDGGREVTKLKPLQELDFPEGYEPLEKNIKYLVKRRISLKKIIEHKIGICRSGPYRNRVVLPMFMEGKLYFWQCRATSRFQVPKVLGAEVPQSRRVLFNLDKARKHDTIVICEGFFSALRAGPNAVSTQGKAMSDDQLTLLLKANPKRIVLFWDADAHSEIRQYAQMLGDFFDVRCVFLREGDPDDRTEEECQELIENAESWEPLKKIEKRELFT